MQKFMFALLLMTNVAHAAPGEALNACAKTLATEVFTNAKAKSVPKSDDLFGGIVAYVRVICIETRGLAQGLSKDETDTILAAAISRANGIVYFGQN